MNIIPALIEAFESLSANKLRSGLTILGIVIGVAAVIAMVSIGRGAENTITGSIQGIGTNLIFVLSGGVEEVRNPKPLTLGDANAIADPFQAPSVSAVAPFLQGQGQVSFGGESTVTTLQGVTPEYGPVRNTDVTEGEFINEAHLLGQASVALLGTDVAERLFDRKAGLVGETVRIEGQPFRVIGVLEERGGSAFTNQDDVVMVPLTTAQTRLLRRASRDRVDMIMVQAASAADVSQASEEIAQILRARHRTAIGADDFTILTQQDFLDTARTITSVLTIFLGGIAAISLLVGGIGIMNIMLASVLERIREIGVRRAMGATQKDILAQFLSEAVLISVVGGVAGILVGGSLSIGIEQLAGIRTIVSAISVIVAFGVSFTVGIIFGIVPAHRAAQQDPVVCLRYE